MYYSNNKNPIEYGDRGCKSMAQQNPRKRVVDDYAQFRLAFLQKKLIKNDPENELREVLRQFARKVLNSQKLRETAAKKIGSKPSYIRAMLDQRKVGGLGAWSALILHCFDILGIDALSELSVFMKNPDLISKRQSQTRSEIVFRNLDQISIVNEDIKFQLATHLQMMLTELEQSLENQR